ncbi:MAG: 2OG-Fe(II) oxygenase [Janthinobacterium lividum]
MQFKTKSRINEIWPDFDCIPAHVLDQSRRFYEGAQPFSHLVFDDLFLSEPLIDIDAAYESVDESSWHLQSGPLQAKRRTRHNSPLPPIAQSYFNMLSSGPFIRFLTAVTGIPHLLPDPALHGGGMHEVREGGHFQVHVDFQKSPVTGLQNRLAVITYLNDGWTEADGGALELWDQESNSCSKKIIPTFGRVVIMKQFEGALHGHSVPVQPGKCRRALIAYFYTNGRGARAGDTTLETQYLIRPEMRMSQKAEILLRPLLPPVVIKSIKSLVRPGR